MFTCFRAKIKYKRPVLHSRNTILTVTIRMKTLVHFFLFLTFFAISVKSRNLETTGKSILDQFMSHNLLKNHDFIIVCRKDGILCDNHHDGPITTSLPANALLTCYNKYNEENVSCKRNDMFPYGWICYCFAECTRFKRGAFASFTSDDKVCDLMDTM